MTKQTTDVIQGTLDMLILKTLSVAPMHGYGIARRIEQVSRGVFNVNPGSVLTSLHRLERAGWLDDEWRRTGAATAFAALATALAALGLYGVLAYSVAQRSREIALRFALGAPPARIRVMVLRQVGATVTGLVLGGVAALLLGRAARSLLFGVDAADPAALLGGAVVLGAVMLGAAYLPARRARAWTLRWRCGTSSACSVDAAACERAEARKVAQRGLLVAGLLVEPGEIEMHVGDARVEAHRFQVFGDGVRRRAPVFEHDA